MGKHTVKNYPSPRLMKTIGATNQSVSEAIGELVANSFDARIAGNKVNIIVDLRDNEIKIIDDGKGMTLDVLEKAVCIAEDMSRHIERGENAKGHFGMGFKTSCSTLGHFYEIYTKSETDGKEYHVEFDIDEYSSRPTNADAWDVEIEDSDNFSDSPLKNYTHGTAFVIKKLKNKDIYFGAVYDYLGEAFKGHLETGDTIQLVKEDGTIENTIPKIYQFINNTKIDINEYFDFTEDNGTKTRCTINGWMALDYTTHNNGNYGFNIYRNNQLLEKWNKDWFTPHLMTSRIIGEVNMDFLEATFYKQGTQQSPKWEVACECMKEYLKGIVKASREISKKGNVNNPTELRKIVKTLNDDYGTEYSQTHKVDNNSVNIDNGKNDKKEKSIKNQIKDCGVEEESLILDDYGEIVISYIERDAAADYPFDYIFSENISSNDEGNTVSELQVILIKNHPIWNYKIDNELKKTLVIADSIYRVLVEKLNMNPSGALNIKNRWINKKIEKKG